MKVCVFSDIHGYLPAIETIPECDLVLIAGDVVPLSIQRYSEDSREWFKHEFTEWAHNLHTDKVIFIAGNHDFYCERHPDVMKILFPEDDKVTYLHNEFYMYMCNGQVLTIFGTPYCKEFGYWAFMLPQDCLKEKFDAIPPHVDILLSHDAPYGNSDILEDKTVWWYTTDHIGNLALREAIEINKPRYNFHGHLHSTNHECEMIGDTKVYNVSILGEQYTVDYEPLIIEL